MGQDIIAATVSRAANRLTALEAVVIAQLACERQAAAEPNRQAAIELRAAAKWLKENRQWLVSADTGKLLAEADRLAECLHTLSAKRADDSGNMALFLTKLNAAQN